MLALKPDYLPDSIIELIDVVGMRAAQIIVNDYGGITLCVPPKASTIHRLYGRIGAVAFAKLVKHYGNEEIEIARCAAGIRAALEAECAEAYKNGAKTTELARHHGYTARGMRKLLRRVKAKANDPQESLF